LVGRNSKHPSHRLVRHRKLYRVVGLDRLVRVYRVVRRDRNPVHRLVWFHAGGVSIPPWVEFKLGGYRTYV
jgi:hypothetical protein